MTADSNTVPTLRCVKASQILNIHFYCIATSKGGYGRHVYDVGTDEWRATYGTLV